MYNLTALQNSTDISSMLLSLDEASGNLFVMGILIVINIVLFLMIYRTSGLKSAVVGSVFPVAFMAALLFPLGLISQPFFISYMVVGVIGLFVLFQNR